MGVSDSPTHKKRRVGQHIPVEQYSATQQAFLEAYEKTANLLTAAVQAGINRTTVYYWLEHDEKFSFAYNLADKAANMNIEAEIHRRGMTGWQEPVYQLGKYCGDITKYSDTLLIFYAKRRMPEYRDKHQLEVTTQSSTQEASDVLDAIASAVAPYPEAKIAVAAILAEKSRKT